MADVPDKIEGTVPRCDGRGSRRRLRPRDERYRFLEARATAEKGRRNRSSKKVGDTREGRRKQIVQVGPSRALTPLNAIHSCDSLLRRPSQIPRISFERAISSKVQ